MLLIKLINLDPARINKIAWILKSGLINKDVWLAGGALRTLIDQNETICDYDLFFKDQYGHPFLAHMEDSTNRILVEQTRNKLIKLGFKLTYECPEGKLYTYQKKLSNDFVDNTYKVQLITEHFYNSPEELLSTFDLSPTYFCTDGKYLWTNKLAIASVKAKICALLKLTYPVSTFNRIIKYYGKGYSCLPAIETYVGNLLDSDRIQYTEETMRRYID